MTAEPLLPFGSDCYVQDELHTRLRLFDLIEELFYAAFFNQVLDKYRNTPKTMPQIHAMAKEQYRQLCKEQKIYRHIEGTILIFSSNIFGILLGALQN